MFQPLIQPLRQTDDSKNIMFKYIEYPVNTEAKTFKELFVKLDEIQTNDIANSCFLNLIINTYATKINQRYKTKASKRGNYNKFELNHETLCDMLGIEMKNSDIGVTLEQSKVFFRKYHLGLKAVNIYGTIIFDETSTVDYHISPSTLYILVHNNHVYRLNCNDRAFQQILNFKKNNKSIVYEEEVSSTYPFQDFEKLENVKTVFINNNGSIPDVFDKIKQCIIENPETKFKFICENSVERMLFYMVNESSYIPAVNYVGDRVVSLVFKSGRIKHIIQNSVTENDTHNEIQPDEYENYKEADKQFYSWLINKDLISHSSKQVEEIEEKYRNAPISGYFKTQRYGLYYAIDRNKSYTSLLKEMQFIPVFTTFDDFQKYDHHDIEDYTQYLIEVKSESMRNNILFEGKISKIYGYILNKIDLKDIEILYFRRPCRLVESFAKNHISDLWNFKISNDPFFDEKHKKYIANINIGKLEKKYNKINTCKVFFNKDEAVYYSYKRDADGHKQLDKNGKEIKIGKVIKLDDCDFIVDPAGNEGTFVNYSKSVLYLIQSNKKVKLNEGFVPIKDFIYNLQRYV
jgi:hypothetical protein